MDLEGNEGCFQGVPIITVDSTVTEGNEGCSTNDSGQIPLYRSFFDQRSNPRSDRCTGVSLTTGGRSLSTRDERRKGRESYPVSDDFDEG